MLALLFAALAGAVIPTDPSCCSESATSRFVALADDPAFGALHDLRQDRAQVSRGKFVSGNSSSGSAYRGWLVAPKTGPSKATILMIHEWWGLNDYIKEQAEKLSDEGYTVLAVDLYGGKVGKTPAEATELMRGVKEEAAQNSLMAALDYVRTDQRIKAAKVGVIGWCFGGGWSLRTALAGGEKIDACVIYYGMPEADTEKLKPLKAPVLGIFGKLDGSINPEVVAKFEAAMKASGKALEVHSYDAGHGFANPSGQRYNSEAAKDAWSKTLAFFKRALN